MRESSGLAPVVTNMQYATATALSTTAPAPDRRPGSVLGFTGLRAREREREFGAFATKMAAGGGSPEGDAAHGDDAVRRLAYDGGLRAHAPAPRTRPAHTPAPRTRGLSGPSPAHTPRLSPHAGPVAPTPASSRMGGEPTHTPAPHENEVETFNSATHCTISGVFWRFSGEAGRLVRAPVS
jgi:hypothetical protein